MSDFNIEPKEDTKLAWVTPVLEEVSISETAGKSPSSGEGETEGNFIS